MASGSRDKSVFVYCLNNNKFVLGYDIITKAQEYDDDQRKPFSPPYILLKLTDHTDKINAVVFNLTNYGLYLATGACDKQMLVYDLSFFSNVINCPKVIDNSCSDTNRFESLNIIMRYNDHSDGISSIAFSKDDEYIASGSYDKTAKIYCFNKFKENYGKLVYSIQGYHNISIKFISFSYENNYFASVGWDEKAIIYKIVYKGGDIAYSINNLFNNNDCCGWLNCITFSVKNFIGVCSWNNSIYIFA